VVNPTIGVPIFLRAVAGTSLFVHYELLTKTTWVPTFLQGGTNATKVAEAPVAAPTVTAQPATPAKQKGLRPRRSPPPGPGIADAGPCFVLASAWHLARVPPGRRASRAVSVPPPPRA
jgi:light-harvesting protein B-800-850 alpha chain